MSSLHQSGGGLSRNSSSSSAIDLTGTPAGIIASAPPSPSLDPTESDNSSVSRRRPNSSRGARTGQDPPHIDDLPKFELTQQALLQYQGDQNTSSNNSDDPFDSPTDDRFRFHTTSRRRYDSNSYSTTHSGPSTTSLLAGVGTRNSDEMEGQREDDEARLTTNMSRNPTEQAWQGDDMEQSAGASPRARRRTVRTYTGSSPSPLRKTGTVIKTVGSNLRRMSLRVVNLRGAGLENQIKLDDEDEKEDSGSLKREEGPITIPAFGSDMPLRGRTICCLGPSNRLRLALYNFLIHPFTEPVILLLIIINAVVLTIQGAKSLSLADDDAEPPRMKGYFQAWEDYVLFALFVIFSIEAFARICVSGFLFDPDIPASTFFTAPLSSHPDMPVMAATQTTVPTSSNLARQASLTQGVGGPLSRGLTLTQRLDRLQRNLKRPWALPYSSEISGTSTHRDLPTTTSISSSSSLSSQPRPINFVQEKLVHAHNIIREPAQPTFLSNMLRSDRKNPGELISLPFRLSIRQISDKTSRNLPYLRQSWSRIDLVAILSFWVTFVLATTGVERGSKHIGIFRAMSVIRTARLLTITSGTTTIMHSLKTARPLLASVAYFFVFAMMLFSIIGVQSFKGSFRRSCSLLGVNGEEEIQLEQFCGGYIDSNTMQAIPFLMNNGEPSPSEPKGYICPLGQVCKENEINPNNNVESFDTIYYAAFQVIVAATANGWTPVMYSMIDSEFFVSSLFFICCVIILNFWLLNLFVAVITNTFSAIRAETKKSAFGAAELAPIPEDQDDDWPVDGRKNTQTNWLRTVYTYSKWFWVLLALTSLVLQATRTADVSETHAQLMSWGELAITALFDIEIIWRLVASLPDWRTFFAHGHNWLDLTLAVGSTVIQIPAIKNSMVYPWFTIFQLARFYRVILVVPRMKPLMLTVFGNMYGLVNMSLFLILVNYIAALVAIQLLRGDLSKDVSMNFSEIFISFLGVYQVFSSEDWTGLVYDAAEAETPLGQTAVIVIFFSAWLMFAYFIVMQMFIAVINENFQVAEEHKKSKQASQYWATHRVESGRSTWMRRLNPYRWVRANPVKVKVENLPSNLVLPMQKALVQDYAGPSRDEATTGSSRRGMRHYTNKSLGTLQKLFAGDSKAEDFPLQTIKHTRNETLSEEMERHLELLASVNPETSNKADMDDAIHERRAQKADFIRDHPTYDKTFWVFSQKNPIRRLCQKAVAPANGPRIFGTPHSPTAHPVFQMIIFLVVIGGIVTEIIATPMYRRNFFAENGFNRNAWFDTAEAAFGLTLLLEFFIKIVADGFLFTPNAYIKSIWNIIDFFILAGLLVNVITGLIFIGGLTRLTRSLKALRVLRLITLFDRMRNSFQTLIISGASRIMDAAILAILYMIPYAVWGLNIFAGQMNQCNDENVQDRSECVGEFVTSVVGDDKFGFPVPRAWDNPSPSTTFSFDNFRSSLLILFEIVSLEGWIDVMNTATSIVGKNDQPQTNVSEWNALFFLIYHLVGGVVILTLFISIIIGNFSSRTGTAFLTQAQREWIDLQKLFQRQRPSKRPQKKPAGFRGWCFDRAVSKHGWWSRGMTFMFGLHVIVLMTQTYTMQNVADALRNDFFLAITFIYIVDVLVRLTGLGWNSFRANGWNLFDVVVTTGSFVTTFIARFGTSSFVASQLQKLFLVSIAFKLVQRSNSLNKLFKTAIASLPTILSLLLLWLILFGFFAILKVEVFGLTKWGGAENHNQNYASVSSALVMLSFMSTGEGWNQFMHDYAVVYPRCTNASELDSESDCGSIGWSFTLFIMWNILSMYIFVNLFTGVVVESFSYVFQTTGGAKSITREQMRSFKKIWAEYANPKTGNLEPQNFVRFFGKLNGVFEVRIYPTEWNIPNIVAACRDTSSSEPSWTRPRVYEGIDLTKLERALNTIDYSAIRKRRAVYSRLYHEATITHRGEGISFTKMLILLAHHKLIVDHEALVLNDLVLRTETNKLVTDLVNLDRVHSLLKTITCRRRFLAHLEQKRISRLDVSQDVPAIVIDSMPGSPQSTRDISSMYDSAPSSPTPDRRQFRPDMSPLSLDRLSISSPGSGLQRSSRRGSDLSMLSADLGYRYPRDSMSEDDPQLVLSSMQNSIWGDMMSEAIREEDKR
ncbi:calcium channel subunit cch1 [Moniliophthora roreri MCA 2997]|uniref:Calcium-channel protein CCH1 n=1 Tax=Moniliophthora roreri (strain MCA 2997) TaxID=1381753 RepID=V2WY90_MONRO|nr:calcium channel subunit cch1 [Moniliophthora roreri MCA 2997]